MAGDAIILCIDCEGWQGLHDDNPSELGFAVLDTRKLQGLTMNEWRNKLKLSTFHFRIKETMNVRPQNPYSRKVMHPDKFQYGKTQILPEKERSRLLDTFFRIPGDVSLPSGYTLTVDNRSHRRVSRATKAWQTLMAKLAGHLDTTFVRRSLAKFLLDCSIFSRLKCMGSPQSQF